MTKYAAGLLLGFGWAGIAFGVGSQGGSTAPKSPTSASVEDSMVRLEGILRKVQARQPISAEEARWAKTVISSELQQIRSGEAETQIMTRVSGAADQAIKDGRIRPDDKDRLLPRIRGEVHQKLAEAQKSGEFALQALEKADIRH
jgi:hypothetical protein